MRKWAKRLCLFLAMCGFFIVFFEGLASITRFFHHFATASRETGGGVQTRYDPDLGWSGIPKFYSQNMYGAGIYLRTNSKGFRSNQETETKVPDGKFRVICSGDSFTLGLGVDNDHTWCQELSSLDDRFEAVNMGQGGYGCDQAYLWYIRDGRGLDHDAQIFALIGPDLQRMREASFFGYGKPVLVIEDGKLKATNIPAPRHPMAAWLAEYAGPFADLSAVKLLTDLTMRGGPAQNNWFAAKEPVFSKILESLQTTNAAKKSSLLLLYLPVKLETETPQMSARGRKLLSEEAQRLGIPFLDMTDEFAAIPASRINGYFGSTRHYSNEANAYVAAAVHRWLLERPEIVERLGNLKTSAANSEDRKVH